MRSSMVAVRRPRRSVAGSSWSRPQAQTLSVAHPVYQDLRVILHHESPLVNIPEATYMCAAATAWAPAGGQQLADVMFRLGMGSHGRCTSVSAQNPILQVDSRAHFIRDEDGDIGIIVCQGQDASEAGFWLSAAGSQNCAMPDGRGEVHRGFLNSMLPLWDSVVGWLSTPATAVRRLFVTGHGVGGAIAVLLGARLAAVGLVSLRADGCTRLQGIHTFGQPRVGDHEFAAWAEEWVGECYCRYVYHSDPMSHRPVSLLGYQHAGRECHVEGGQWKLRPNRAATTVSALLRLGQQGARTLARRVVRGSAGGRPHPHHGVEHYLRVSRAAVNRAVFFP